MYDNYQSISFGCLLKVPLNPNQPTYPLGLNS